MDVSERNQIAVKYYGIISKIASRISHRLPSHVSLDDVVSAGSIGLLDCIGKYDPQRSVRFEKYAEFRIKGAMLDEMRGADHLSRDQRALTNALRAARKKLEMELGRAPDADELCREMGCSLEYYHTVILRVASASTVSLEESLARDEGPEDLADHYKDLRIAIEDGIGRLPLRMKTIIRLYYYEDYSLKEIGRIFGLTESRICQLHRQAIEQLKRELLAATDEEEDAEAEGDGEDEAPRALPAPGPR